VSKKPSPDEVLARQSEHECERGEAPSTWELVGALREAIKQRDSGWYHAQLQAQLAEAQAQLDRAKTCWDHETKRADDAQAKAQETLMQHADLCGEIEQYKAQLAPISSVLTPLAAYLGEQEAERDD
jgi:chromosome segregation ATPase